MHKMLESRPKTRGDCKDGPRPCPYITCRHHLALDEHRGHPKPKVLRCGHGDIEHHTMRVLLSMADTCSLDVADRGEHTLAEVGEFLGRVSRERARQIQEDALGLLLSDSEDLRDCMDECAQIDSQCEEDYAVNIPLFRPDTDW